MFATQAESQYQAYNELNLSRDCGYSIHNNGIEINVADIANSRPDGDVSGTLSLELWALPTPYQGQDFAGTALAGREIGVINGQYHLPNARFNMDFQQPPAGHWHLCLMLREWTAYGYVTRDFVNFDLPYQVAAQTGGIRSEGDNVVNLFAPAAERAKPVVTEAKADPETEAAPAQTAEQNRDAASQAAATSQASTAKTEAKAQSTNQTQTQVEAKASQTPSQSAASQAQKTAAKASTPARETRVTTPATGKAEAMAKTANKAAVSNTATAVKTTATATKPSTTSASAANKVAAASKATGVTVNQAAINATKAASAAGAVNLNKATLDQLCGVEGLNKKMAEMIVKQRPYKAVDDLLKIKGLGKKSIDKMRSQLSV